MDVVRGQGAVGEGLEEEAHGFEEVVFGVDDGGFDVAAVAVEECGDFREEAQFVGGGFGGVGGAGADVELGGFGHAVAEGGDFFVGGGGEVLGGVVSEGESLRREDAYYAICAAATLGGVLQCCVDGSI